MHACNQNELCQVGRADELLITEKSSGALKKPSENFRQSLQNLCVMRCGGFNEELSAMLHLEGSSMVLGAPARTVAAHIAALERN